MRTLLVLIVGGLAGTATAQPKPKQSPKRSGILKKLGSTNGFGPGLSAFGDSAYSKNRKRIDAAYKKANRAYERGDWAQAISAYKAAWAIDKEKTMMIGGSGKAFQSRASLACEALGRLDCALDAVKARQRSGLAIGLGGRGAGGRRYVSMSERVERAMPTLIEKRALALKEEDPQKRAELYADLLSRDPRCPGRNCPPFTLREAGEAAYAVGNRSRSIDLLEQYLKVMPKAADRKAVQQVLARAQAAEKQAENAEAADVKARKLVIAGGQNQPAPWLRLGTWPVVRFEHLRYGGTVGVAQMQVGKHTEWLGVRYGDAATGPLQIPDTFKWLGVSQSGAVYYADAAGALFRAADLTAAQRPFTRLATLSGVEHWHLSGETLVGSGAQVVHVSLDGGRTFTTRQHAKSIGKAWARADGMVAFGDESGAWTSRDGGKTWQGTPLGDMRKLRRDGQRIYLEPVSPDDYFGNTMNCAQGELTAGGQWIVPVEHYGRDASNGWDTIFAVGNFARSPGTVASGLGRKSAVKGKPALPVVKACQADPEAWFKANRGGAGGMGGFGEPCRGLDCLVRPSLPATPVRFGLLGDARCGAQPPSTPAVQLVPARRRQLSRRRPRSGGSNCDAPETAGTLVQASPTKVERRPPIENCRLQWMRSVGGLGIGVCQGASTPELVVLDAGGKVRERQPLGGPLEQLMLAADGTIVAQVRHAQTHAAWVRRPIALNAADAWRQQTAPKAVAWRPITGGRALAITPGEMSRPRFEVVKSTADGEWMQGPGKPEVAAWQACQHSAFERAPDLHGTATVIRTIGAGRSVQSVRIENDVQGSDAAFVECLRAATAKASVPWGKTGELVHVLEFHRDLASYRLLVADVDGSIRAVTRDVEFEAPPKQFAVQADGTVQVKPTGWPERTCLVPTHGPTLCSREK